MVETKSAAANDIESKIYSCYLLLFDNATGNRINTPENLVTSSSTTLPTQFVKLDKSNATSVTACFIANVPENFAKGIIGLNKPSAEVNPDAQDNEYLNTAILDITYASSGIIGTPNLNLNSDGSTMTECIPMMGVKSDINLTLSSTGAIEVPIKRLFAKVTANLSMDLLDTGILGVQTNTYYELLSYTVCNLPTKLRICEPSANAQSYETSWWESKYSNAYAADQIRNTDNVKIYNAAAIGYETSKSYSMSFYVPEYYLEPFSEADFNNAHKDDTNFSSFTYNTQECKPLMFDSSVKRPIYLRLIGSYKQATGTDAGLQYDIFLGENNSSSFTLKRNKHYTNNLTIQGVENANIDWRVTVTDGNDLISIYGEVANCYVIADTREVSIKAYKGAYKYHELPNAHKCKGTSVRIIAQDKDNVTFENPDNPFILSEGDDGVKVISFKVNEIDYDCNMVIAIMDGEEVEWSWHLWFIKGLRLGNMGFFEPATQDLPSNKGKLMDSNLGVARSLTSDWIGGTATGFYYKYGHRAPYFEDKIHGNGAKYHGYKSGDYSDWNTNGKSRTDPCPPGYRVPSPSALVTTATNVHATVYGAFRYWNNGDINDVNDIYLPYAGEIQSDYTTRSNESESRYYSTIITEEMELSKYRFTNVRYRGDNKTGGEYGVLATTDANAYLQYLFLRYSFSEFVKKAIPEILDYEIGTRKNIWSPYQFTGEYIKDVAYSSLSTEAQLAYGTIKTFKPSISDLFGTAIINNYSANKNNGYQVRCIKE
jgi:hypothetical protein